MCYQWDSLYPTQTALIGCTGLLASRKRRQLLRYKLVHHPLLTGIQISLPLNRELSGVSWIVPSGLLSAYLIRIIIFCALSTTYIVLPQLVPTQFIMLSFTNLLKCKLSTAYKNIEINSTGQISLGSTVKRLVTIVLQT